MTQPDQGEQWHRLSMWMIAVKPVEMLPSLIPVIIAVFLTGRTSPMLGAIIAAVGIPVIAVVPWLTTRYQVTDERVSVRSGLVTRKTASAPRDRIRSVELSATLPHRILKLSKVRIGTGGDTADTVVEINAISTPAAVALREQLITWRSDLTRPSESGYSPQPSSVELTRFTPGWLRFAPFSLAGFAAAGAIVGIGAQLINDLDLGERGVEAASGIAERFESSRALLIVLIVVSVVVVATLLSLIGYALSYWNFSVTRTTTSSGRSLHITRGLLTTNSTTLDEDRVHGVHLHEPVLMRPVHGAKLSAIATGSDKHPLLLPPAPHAEAVRVAEAVSGDSSELNQTLRPHGRAARRRRLTRAAVPGVVIVAAVVVVVVLAPSAWPALPVAVVIAAGLAALGAPRYRHLGTDVTASSVVFAPPTIARQRRVLHRDGVIGTMTQQTFFQRRAGVSTVIVATAAGSEGYSAIDLADADASALIAELQPAEIKALSALSQ
ncbi:PH domain-containing protein [Gordonia sp. CPCC 205333]|uniref:PH domain-containing protein n=1 Tax=Gordonia sp. CPCC 205333 TaxID=3140790 RepID=UPI003AF3FC8E